MIWVKLKEGICFAEDHQLIPWNLYMHELKSYNSANVSFANGQTTITWKNKTLFGKISGNWYAYYYAHEISKRFKSINLSFVGDKKSLEEFNLHKEILIEQFGPPAINLDKSSSEKEIRWSNGKVFVHQCLFEMHSLHYALTIGII